MCRLSKCGFIRKYKNYSKQKNEAFFQLIDPFVAFYLNFMSENNDLRSWMEYVNTPSYNSWRGNAFEMTVLNHVEQIKKALGISGVESKEYAWRSRVSDPGVQIDLLIDRRDGVINLCEAKYSNTAYEISSEEYAKIERRMSVFQKETGTEKSIHITLITVNGLAKNKYSGIALNTVSGDELFE